MISSKFSGKTLAANIYEQLEVIISKLKEHDITPSLAIIQVGGDESSALYAQRKIKTAAKLSLKAQLYQLPASTKPEELANLIDKLNKDPDCHGILVEQPLPAGFPKWLNISPEKDLDCAAMISLGRLLAGDNNAAPCTALAAFEVAKNAPINLCGAKVTVIGRSLVVGKPLSLLMTNANATVTLCHSKTKDLAAVCQQSDMVICATGCPGLLREDMVPENICLIDVGTTPTSDGLKGDIDPPANEKAAFYTPVPGGVGPVTVAILLRKLVQAAAAQNGVSL